MAIILNKIGQGRRVPHFRTDVRFRAALLIPSENKAQLCELSNGVVRHFTELSRKKFRRGYNSYPLGFLPP